MRHRLEIVTPENFREGEAVILLNLEDDDLEYQSVEAPLGQVSAQTVWTTHMKPLQQFVDGATVFKLLHIQFHTQFQMVQKKIQPQTNNLKQLFGRQRSFYQSPRPVSNKAIQNVTNPLVCRFIDASEERIKDCETFVMFKSLEKDLRSVHLFNEFQIYEPLDNRLFLSGILNFQKTLSVVDTQSIQKNFHFVVEKKVQETLSSIMAQGRNYYNIGRFEFVLCYIHPMK